MSARRTAPPAGTIALSAPQLSDLTAALQSVQSQFHQLSHTISILSSVFSQLSAQQADDAAHVEEDDDEADGSQPARSDGEGEDAEESSTMDAEEKRRDNSRIVRALDDEQKRYERPDTLQWPKGTAALYTVNSKPTTQWKKAAALQQPTANTSSTSPGRTLSPLSAEPAASFSPRSPPLTSSIVALPPLSSVPAVPRPPASAALPALPAAALMPSRVPQLSEARRKSTSSEGGEDEESKRQQQSSSASPVSSSTSISAGTTSTKRITPPLVSSSSQSALQSFSVDGRASRAASDTSQPSTTQPNAASPRGVHPAPVLRPLRTNAISLDDAIEDEAVQPSAHPHSVAFNSSHPPPHAFASSTPTSPASRHIFLSHPNRIKLNVGGTIFHTTLSTLTSPASANSMLHSIFSSSHFPLELDSKGAYFVDRDPTLFRLILNFLRDGSLSLSTLSPHTKQSLLREARYFSLEPLVLQLQAELRQTQARLRRELSQEKEYKIVMGVDEKDMAQLFQRMTIMEGYDFEDWIVAGAGIAAGQSVGAASSRGGSLGSLGGVVGGAGREKEKSSGSGGVHVLFSKKLSRGELMLLDRLQTGM